VCLLALADSLATGSRSEYQETSKRVRDLAAELCVLAINPKDNVSTIPLLSGDDVIACLGLDAGPGVGNVLKQAAQLERDGVLQNRDAALAWLRSLQQNG
jgi:hypothetical protein